MTEHERFNYLNDHISYEVIMLNYTFMRLMTFKASTAEDELERNAFLGSLRRPRVELGRVPIKEGAEE